MKNVITREDIELTFNISKITATNWMKKGILPPPVKLADGKYIWFEDELLEFLKKQPRINFDAPIHKEESA